MLLYTRLAPPKPPKRRSRGGCTFCKEKKKKCDEKRPTCSRCSEQGVECVYGTVKPRQRKRRESAPHTAAAGTPSEHYSAARRLSELSYYSHSSSYLGWGVENRGQDLTRYGEPPSVVFNTHFSLSEYPPIDILDDFPNEDPQESTNGGSPEADGPVDDEGASPCGPISPRTVSKTPDLAMIAPRSVASPLQEFHAPAFTEFTERPNRRALIDHFCNVLSHLIVFREETGNPFQQLILPLTRKSSPVLNSILALSCAHLEYRGIENSENSLYFHNQAIQGVAQMIAQKEKANRTDILAAIMLLVYYECLVQKGRSNIVAGHLKGALTIMCSTDELLDPAGVFLERAFRFYDVITALSNNTSPISTTPSPGGLLPFSPIGATPTSPLNNIDTLLGMSTTLWPIIHRLSGLSSLKSSLDAAISSGSSPTKIAVLRTEFSSTAQAIEAALNNWQPQLPADFTPPPGNDDPEVDPAPVAASTRSSNIPSIYHNALAYRHASLLYLYRTILRYQREHALVRKHTRLTLKNCVATVGHRGPMSALLWPLFVAACEAGAGKDRELAREAFEKVERRQGMRNIGRAWEVVGEVWKRVDEEGGKEEGDKGEGEGEGDEEGKEKKRRRREKEGEELWRRVCKEMEVSLVFG
ncbi:fungal-specific transcription factor domain-containing protein [Cercophora samala]|uniref:Fungal-specific transcription factor domain-containing protein n=1 Tax=Cercophora samala TaxID=330535 RepID=A0AA39ZPD0_9PEZI|nr:fungal-specific transcription factor domain-containing protein [Cercophora samala]